MTIAVVIKPPEAVIIKNVSSFMYNSQTRVLTYWIGEVEHFRLTSVLGITGVKEEENKK